MKTLKINNPADGSPLAEVPAGHRFLPPPGSPPWMILGRGMRVRGVAPMSRPNIGHTAEVRAGELGSLTTRTPVGVPASGSTPPPRSAPPGPSPRLLTVSLDDDHGVPILH